MTHEEYIKIIREATERMYTTNSREDFIDSANSADIYLRDLVEDVQDEIVRGVETLADSFGGSITMRELKGEWHGYWIMH